MKPSSKHKKARMNDWVWMPHPGHFICSHDCKFHLNTKAGKYIVSTVGEYFPDSAMRELLAESRGVKLIGLGDQRRADYAEKIGFEDIGHKRKYETMVFKAKESDVGCCPWEAIVRDGELDVMGYNDPRHAYLGHLEMCRKWENQIT